MTRSVGLGSSLGRSSRLAAALTRLEYFGLAQAIDPDTVLLRGLAPALDGRTLPKLGLTARGIHNFLTNPLPPR